MISISYETSKSVVERITELRERSRSLVNFFSYLHGITDDMRKQTHEGGYAITLPVYCAHQMASIVGIF